MLLNHSRRRYREEDLAVKLRVSHLVESVDFEPRELPPAAILIVRRFADPMPRRLRSDASALVPATDWERTARSGLAELARRAARPAHGAVPSNANAVLFADQAELLACFSRDLLRGEMSTLWWWRALLRSVPSAVSASLVEAWQRDIRYVPSALAQLSARGEAARVIGSLTPGEAWWILEEVAHTFELEFVAAAARWPSSSSMAGDSFSGAGGAIPVEQANGFSTSPQAPTPIAAPWHDKLAHSVVPANLGQERSALLAISLLLSQAPRVVRSQEFARAFIRWRHSLIRPTDATDTQPFEPAGERESESRLLAASPAIQIQPVDANEQFDGVKSSPLAGRAEYAHDGGSTNFELTPKLDATSRPTETSTGLEGLSEAQGEHPTQSGAEALQPQALSPHLSLGEKGTPQSAQRNATAAPVTETVSFAEAAGSVPEIKQSLAAGECVSTALGGVFFLINLLKALQLPQSIESACDCQLGLAGWELIELIARCLLKSSRAHLVDDPLWALLLLLDGRPEEQKAGANFSPPGCYRIPESWIPPDVTDRLDIRCSERRLEVWNPLGFPQMVHYFEQPPSRAIVEHELERNRARATLSPLRRRNQGVEALNLTLDRPLRRLLAFLMPFLRWRLTAALGLSTDRKPDLAEAVLLRASNVWVTSTHVDLVMDLNQATAPVRFAGLDADPGWVPELGRVVKFHFNQAGRY